MRVFLGIIALLVSLAIILSWFFISAPQVKKTKHVAGATVVATPLPSSHPTITQTVQPSSTVSVNKNLEFVKVIKVVDGDTIEISGGKTLRYIGIDTPETVDPRRPVQCFGKEASEKNTSLVLGATIGIEKDVSETDRYGRLLRYVYKDNIFINELLVSEGFAVSSSYPPDVKYQDLFKDAERSARENALGLWGSCATQKTKDQPSTKQVGNTTAPQGTYACDCAKACSQMFSCDEAYYQLKNCGCSARDGNNDGVPCESLCRE
ncbi:MAG: thermonuclease family protein [Candidatus Levybacteria bacterium]|nr:thermonuclease family protein [Candidatus Levybacteria bacterium]